MDENDYKNVMASLFRIKETNGDLRIVEKEWNAIKQHPILIFLAVEYSINVFDSKNRRENEDGARWLALFISNIFKSDPEKDEEFGEGIKKDVNGHIPKEKKFSVFVESLLMALRGRVLDFTAPLQTRVFYGMVARELVYAVEETKYNKKIKNWFSNLLGSLLHPTIYGLGHCVAFTLLEDMHADLLSKRVIMLLAKKCNSPEYYISEGAKNALAHLMANSPEKVDFLLPTIEKALKEEKLEERIRVEVKTEIIQRMNRIKNRIT